MSSPVIGEMFEAYHAALNIDRFGWQWAGVQDEATNPIGAAHPILYIHHGNNGIYFSYLLLKLGIASLPLQNALSIIASAGGLLVAFICFRKLTGSILFASVPLALLSLDFGLISDWSVNIHRGLTYLSVFGAIYVFVEAIERNFRHFGWTAGAFLACLNLLGTDYLYFIFTGLVIIAWIVLNTETWRARFRRIAITGAIFASVFALRQLQIALGWENWTQDFIFQVLNRLHLQFLYPGDWSKRTSEFYASQHVLQTGFTGSTNTLSALSKFVLDSGAALFTKGFGLRAASPLATLIAGRLFFLALGAVTLLELFGRRLEAQRVSLAVLIGGLALMAGGIFANLGYGFAVSAVVSVVFAAGGMVAVYFCGMWPMDRPAEGVGSRVAVYLGLIALFGCFGLTLVVPGYFGGWYWQFRLDAICVAIWMTVLALPYLLSDAFAKHWRSAVGLAAAVKVISLGSLHLALPPSGGDHTEALLKLRGSPTVSNFTPASTASYTRAFSGFIKPEGAHRLLSGGSVTPDDYWMLLERDTANPMYQRPEYLVFYKGLTIFVEDWPFLSEYVPIAEGNDYAIYAIPGASSQAMSGKAPR